MMIQQSQAMKIETEKNSNPSTPKKSRNIKKVNERVSKTEQVDEKSNKSVFVIPQLFSVNQIMTTPLSGVIQSVFSSAGQKIKKNSKRSQEDNPFCFQNLFPNNESNISNNGNESNIFNDVNNTFDIEFVSKSADLGALLEKSMYKLEKDKRQQSEILLPVREEERNDAKSSIKSNTSKSKLNSIPNAYQIGRQAINKKQEKQKQMTDKLNELSLELAKSRLDLKNIEETHKTKIEKMNEELETTKSQYNAVNQEKQELEREIQLTNETNAQLLNTNNQLDENLSKNEEKLNVAKENLLQLDNQLKELQDQIKTLQDKIETIELQLSESQGEYTVAQQEIQKLQDAIKIANQQNAKLLSDNNNLFLEVQDKDKAIEDKKDSLKIQRETIEKQQKTETQLKGEKKELANKNSNLHDKIKEKVEKIEELNSNIKTLRENSEKTAEELSEDKAHNIALQKKYNELQNQIQELKNERNQITANMTLSQETLDENIKLLNQYKTKIQELESENEELNQQKEVLESEKLESNTQYNELKENYKKLNVDYESEPSQLIKFIKRKVTDIDSQTTTHEFADMEIQTDVTQKFIDIENQNTTQKYAEDITETQITNWPGKSKSNKASVQKELLADPNSAENNHNTIDNTIDNTIALQISMATAKLKNQLEEYKKKDNDTKTQIEALQQQIETLEKEIAIVNETNHELFTDNIEFQQQFKNNFMKNRCDNMNLQLNKIEQLEKQNNELTTKNTELQKLFNEAFSELELLNNQLDQKTNNSMQTQTDISDEQANYIMQISNLKVSTESKDIQYLKAENAQQQTDLNQLNTDKTQLQNQLRQLQDKCNLKDAKIEKDNRDNNRHPESINTIQLLKKAIELEKEIKDKDNQIAFFTKQRENNNTTHKKEIDKIQELEKEINAKNHDIAIKQNQIAHLKLQDNKEITNLNAKVLADRREKALCDLTAIQKIIYLQATMNAQAAQHQVNIKQTKRNSIIASVVIFALIVGTIFIAHETNRINITISEKKPTNTEETSFVQSSTIIV